MTSDLPKTIMTWLGRVSAISIVLAIVVSGIGALKFKHHSHKMLENVLKRFSDAYPNITRLHSIGQSYKGRELWVLVIGKYASEHKPLIPNVKYVANMHGNEVVGREMVLHLADFFLTEYGTNETITQFLDTTTVHIMPTMNPDGYAQSIEEDCYSTIGRANAYGYDLNRNFPDPWSVTSIQEQKETSLVRQWIHSMPFVLSANLHGGALVVNYPYDSLNGDLSRPVYAATPDDDVFRHLALTFSRSHHTMHQGGFCIRLFQDGITNGANWYPVIGGMQDYVYRNASGYELLIEMSCCKYPQPSKLPTMWTHNKDALINFLMVVHMGVKGIIYHHSGDRKQGWMPLAGATVVIEGREAAPFTSSDFGEYYKLLLPDSYILKISYPGYRTMIKRFKVSESRVTRKDIYMMREPNMTTMISTNPTSKVNPRMTEVSTLDHLNSGLKQPVTAAGPKTIGPFALHPHNHGISLVAKPIDDDDDNGDDDDNDDLNVGLRTMPPVPLGQHPLLPLVSKPILGKPLVNTGLFSQQSHDMENSNNATSNEVDKEQSTHTPLDKEHLTDTIFDLEYSTHASFDEQYSSNATTNHMNSHPDMFSPVKFDEESLKGPNSGGTIPDTGLSDNRVPDSGTNSLSNNEKSYGETSDVESSENESNIQMPDKEMPIQRPTPTFASLTSESPSTRANLASGEGKADNSGSETIAGKADNPASQLTAGKADNPASQATAGKADNPASQATAGKADNPASQATAGKADNPASQATAGKADKSASQATAGKANNSASQVVSKRSEKSASRAGFLSTHWQLSSGLFFLLVIL